MSTNELHEFKQAHAIFLENRGRNEYRRVVKRYISLLEKGLAGYEEKSCMLLSTVIWVGTTKSKLEERLRHGSTAINVFYVRNIHSNWIVLDNYLKGFSVERPQLPPKRVWSPVKRKVM